jgi:prepilin-type N-terminal cleavage/methylation domain-containing protein
MFAKPHKQLRLLQFQIDSGQAGAQSRFSGFTIVELLISISILSLLMALLLPAVQQARESARATTCRNHLRQIALAALNFESLRGTLPPGYVGPDTPTDSNARIGSLIGPLAQMLPYLDQVPLFNSITPSQFDVRVKAAQQTVWQDEPTCQAAFIAKVPGFVCPSANPSQNSNSGGLLCNWHWYSDAPGHTTSNFMRFPTGHVLAGNSVDAAGRTNYFGVAGWNGELGDPGWDLWKGCFARRSQTRLRDLTDGTSNVLMFGEGLGDVDPATNQLLNGNTWLSTGIYPTYEGVPVNQPVFPMYRRFSSSHSGVAYFALADGSIRGVSCLIDHELFTKRLAGGSDGNLIGDY